MFVQGSLGYKNVLSLGSAYIAGKMNQALQATASLSIHSMKDELKDLTVEQVLLLSLIHSLIKKDLTGCCIFTEITTKIESLNSPHLREWLQEEFFFKYDEVRSALSFAAELTKFGLVFPAVILTILENLYHIYCTPSKRNSLVEAMKTREQRDSESSAENGAVNKDVTEVISQVREDEPPPLPLKQKSRKVDDPSHLKHTPVLLPNRVFGEYSQCEQFALQRENQVSPKNTDEFFKTFNKEIVTPPANAYLRQLSEEFISKEAATSMSAFEGHSKTNVEVFAEVATEADAINEKTGDTALHLAVLQKNVEVIEALIKRGARIDMPNKMSITPMQIAVEREYLEIIRILHKAGADINRKNDKGESLLHIAATSAGLETIELLIELGAELDILDARRQTPLFRAAKKGYLVVMLTLEEKGADIHITDTYGRSLLHYAAWHGQVEVVEWLIKNGLKVTSRTKHGMTPLHWAVANSQLKVAHVLLRVGSEVNARDSAKRTPLFWAAEVGNIALVDLLKSYGGDL